MDDAVPALELFFVSTILGPPFSPGPMTTGTQITQYWQWRRVEKTAPITAGPYRGSREAGETQTLGPS